MTPVFGGPTVIISQTLQSSDFCAMQHPSKLNEKVVAKVIARRGRLHAFETLEPRRTALVVIDLNLASVEQDDACKAMIPRINALATALRKHGGLVAWVRTEFRLTPQATAQYGIDASRFAAELDPNGTGAQLWPGLVVEMADVQAMKRGASAFFPGKCELPETLSARNVEHVLIAGTVTNVCCESSARDAVELGFHVTMVSDACAGHSHGLHEATLNTFYRSFGDVRPCDDVARLIAEGTPHS